MPVKTRKKDLIIPTDRQEKGRRIIMANKHREIMFDGGSRSGKTFIIVMCLILLCVAHQGLRVLMCRQVFAHARASLWDQTLIPILYKMQKFGLKFKIDKGRFIVHIGRSQIWLGGLDNKERADKILGQEYGLIYFNEAVEISKSTRDIVKTRLAQMIKGFLNFMIYDCNPRQPTHYLFKEFYGKEKTDSRIALKFIPDDNAENLPDGYIEEILDKLPPDKKKRFREGVWASLPGQVYHNVLESNKIEVEKNIYKFYDDIAVGIDWGHHMCACIWGFKRADKLQAYCIHEIIILGGVTSDLINELDKVYGIKEESYMLYCDHEPDRILELENAGYCAKAAYKAVGAGDSSVEDTELFFDYACENTFDSMLHLTSPADPKNDGQFIYGKHVKDNDHEADASRYCIHGWRMDNNIHCGEHIILNRSVI